MYKLKHNNDIEYGAVPMDTDHILCKNIVQPLNVITSGSLCLLVGSSGSGKTSLLINLISKTGTKNGFKQSFRKCFHKIVVCSPSTHTLRQNVFEGIPQDQLYTDLGECLQDIDGHIEASSMMGDLHGETKYNLLILDDVASQLKLGFNNIKLTSLLQNRRHQHLTVFLISQKWTMIPTGIRSNANVCFIFKPKTMQEQLSITDEILPIRRADSLDLFNYVFDSRYAVLMVDMTLKFSNVFRFFKNFHEIIMPE